jgi:hypothetical protein
MSKQHESPQEWAFRVLSNFYNTTLSLNEEQQVIVSDALRVDQTIALIALRQRSTSGRSLLCLTLLCVTKVQLLWQQQLSVCVILSGHQGRRWFASWVFATWDPTRVTFFLLGIVKVFNTGRSVHWLCSDTGHVHWLYSDTGHVR